MPGADQDEWTARSPSAQLPRGNLRFLRGADRRAHGTCLSHLRQRAHGRGRVPIIASDREPAAAARSGRRAGSRCGRRCAPVEPFLRPGSDPQDDGREAAIPPPASTACARRRSASTAAPASRSGACADGQPEFLGPHALPRPGGFVGDPREGEAVRRLKALSGEHGIWECTHCYLCTSAAPRESIARRDRQARRRGDLRPGIARDRGARHARWFVTSAGTTAGCARASCVVKTLGWSPRLERSRSRCASSVTVKAPLPCRVTGRWSSSRRASCADRAGQQDRRGAPGIVQGERALELVDLAGLPRSRSGRTSPDAAGSPTTRAAWPGSRARARRSTRALAPKLGLELVELERSPAAARRESRSRPRLRPAPERAHPAEAEQAGCDTILTVCNVCTLTSGRRPSSSPTSSLRSRVNENWSARSPHLLGGAR